VNRVAATAKAHDRMFGRSVRDLQCVNVTELLGSPLEHFICTRYGGSLIDQVRPPTVS
jgi:hypothetical protein